MYKKHKGTVVAEMHDNLFDSPELCTNSLTTTMTIGGSVYCCVGMDQNEGIICKWISGTAQQCDAANFATIAELVSHIKTDHRGSAYGMAANARVSGIAAITIFSTTFVVYISARNFNARVVKARLSENRILLNTRNFTQVGARMDR